MLVKQSISKYAWNSNNRLQYETRNIKIKSSNWTMSQPTPSPNMMMARADSGQPAKRAGLSSRAQQPHTKLHTAR